MLFDGVDLSLEPRARTCLVGRNGAGKSTLMKVLTGQIAPDGGERFVQPGLSFASVPQEPVIVGETLADYAAAGGAPHHRADAELEAFGLDPAKGCQGLSGGEIRRAALARAFAEEPDLLLLDEPTNHLDILAIEMLEQRIRTGRAAALIVSHDRAFLQRVTTRCFWLAHRKVRTLDKGFTAFEDWAEQIEANEAENLRRLEKAIERETYWFYRSITAQRTRNEGRARELAEMRKQKAVLIRDQTRPLDMTLEAGGISGKLVAEAKGVSKAFGAKTIVQNFSTRIVRGDRIAIVGPNGAGKTTLIKLLLGEAEADSGTLRLGAGLEVAYLDQARDALKGSETLWDALTPGGGDQVMVAGMPRHVAAYAKDFLFKDSQLRQPVSTLSGGERNRLLLARALAKPANLLVLDEPTNDLDMETLDLLEDLLADYQGTLLLVSHDRDFIDRLATSTIALDGRGRAVETPGGWQDFVRQNPGFLAPPTVAAPASAPAPVRAEEPKRATKLSYKDQRRLEELETIVADLPGEIAGLEVKLEDPGLYARDAAGFDRIMKSLDAARARLAASEDEWLALEEKREGLNAR
ncbi:MAG: ATP-binding cassette domain-containing protein [Caulobacteraceae bacterium]